MNVRLKLALFTAYVLSSVSGLAILKSHLARLPFPFRGVWATPGVLAYLVLGTGLYLTSFGLWLAILRSVPLASAYPTAVGLTILGSTSVSVVILHENLRADQAVGIALILLGAFLTLRGE
jgi:multidrug transporter EmrE-like cation transporter